MESLNLQLIFLFALLILQTNNIYGQTRTISGTIFNSVTNEPISDIKVSIKGANISSQSDKNGKYLIAVPDTMKTISFSDFVSMNVSEIKHISSTNVNIYLSQKDVFYLTLEELKQIEVKIASKKAESIIETPVSTSVITQAEIENSGATSIPEVLRLLPGLIVREKTNGNYDIHIRGNDNPIYGITTSLNTNTLVMIDGRVVYSYFQGGIFWETLPVELCDIKRIELIRGPSSALYGPNAVSGVINIITKNAEPNKTSFNIAGQTGSLNTKIVNSSVGFAKEKFGIRVSGSYAYKDRHQEGYYITDKNRYSQRDSMWLFTTPGHGGPQQIIDSAETMLRYPNKNLSLDKWGLNVSSYYNLNDNVNFNLSTGIQKSAIQTIHLGQKISPMNNRISNTKYVNFNSNIYGFNSNISYFVGQQNILEGAKGFKFDTETIELSSDYNFTFKNLTIRPGISYRTSMFNDLPYIDITKNEGFIHSKKYINSLSPSIMAEYTLFKKLRLIAAGRIDTYNKPDDYYISYEFASTFKINEKNLIRAVYSKANSGPFIYDFYTDFDINLMPGVVMKLAGNDNLKLIEMNLFEIGYRSVISNKVYLDIELFQSNIHNFSNVKQTETQTIQVGLNEYEYPKKIEKYNLDLHLVQTGTSFNLTYIPFEKLQIKTFGTIQQTKAKKFDLNMYDYENDTLKFADLNRNYTPSFYGGFSINYKPITKLNIFTNFYYLSQQTFTDFEKGIPLTDSKLIIKSKYILNLKISYKVWKNNTVFVNIRNLTNNKTKEFIFADDTGIMFLAGLNMKI